MFRNTKAFSGFSVDDILKAKQFYSQTLGLDVAEFNGMGKGGSSGDGETRRFEVGTCGDERLHHVDLSVAGCGHQRRLGCVGRTVDSPAGGEQHLGDFPGSVVVCEPMEPGNTEVPQGGVVAEARADRLGSQRREPSNEKPEALDVTLVDRVLALHLMFETGP